MTALDAPGLRALQKPLKDRYRGDAESALTPSRAVARLEGDGIPATVEGWAGDVTAGLHPATGGDGTVACSADLLLQAVAACAGVTPRGGATVMGGQLRDAGGVARGRWEARGELRGDRG